MHRMMLCVRNTQKQYVRISVPDKHEIWSTSMLSLFCSLLSPFSFRFSLSSTQWLSHDLILWSLLFSSLTYLSIYLSVVAGQGVKPAMDEKGLLMIPLQKSAKENNKNNNANNSDGHKQFFVELVYLVKVLVPSIFLSFYLSIFRSICYLTGFIFSHPPSIMKWNIAVK